MDHWAIVGTLAAALIGTFTGIYSLLRQGRKDQGDIAELISNAAVSLIEPYKKEVGELRKRIAELEEALKAERDKRINLEALLHEKDKLIAELQNQICIMQAQIEQLQQQKQRRKSAL